MEASERPRWGRSAPATNRRDDGLLAATLDTLDGLGPLPDQPPTLHLDAGYDDAPCRQVLAARGMVGHIATRGVPAPCRPAAGWWSARRPG